MEKILKSFENKFIKLLDDKKERKYVFEKAIYLEYGLATLRKFFQLVALTTYILINATPN